MDIAHLFGFMHFLSISTLKGRKSQKSEFDSVVFFTLLRNKDRILWIHWFINLHTRAPYTLHPFFSTTWRHDAVWMGQARISEGRSRYEREGEGGCVTVSGGFQFKHWCCLITHLLCTYLPTVNKFLFQIIHNANYSSSWKIAQL